MTLLVWNQYQNVKLFMLTDFTSYVGNVVTGACVKNVILLDSTQTVTSGEEWNINQLIKSKFCSAAHAKEVFHCLTPLLFWYCPAPCWFGVEVSWYQTVGSRYHNMLQCSIPKSIIEIINQSNKACFFKVHLIQNWREQSLHTWIQWFNYFVPS